MALLEVRNMSHNFGGLQAVSRYNLSLDPGQITGLIGPNGAGKTTIFNLITGIYQPTEGEVIFEEKNLVGKKTEPDRRTGAGAYLSGNEAVASYERARARENGPIRQADLRPGGGHF